VDVTIPCVCSADHDSDTVTLRDALSPHDAMALDKDIQVMRAEDPDATAGDVLATLSEGYIVRGISSWSLVGEDGEPLPVTKSAIRSLILPNLEAANAIAEEADGLYAEAVMLPLLRRASKSSPPSPTDGLTSAPTDSSATPPRPSKRSSTTTTRTGAIATMSGSHAGASSSSQNSASAA